MQASSTCGSCKARPTVTSAGPGWLCAHTATQRLGLPTPTARHTQTLRCTCCGTLRGPHCPHWAAQQRAFTADGAAAQSCNTMAATPAQVAMHLQELGCSNPQLHTDAGGIPPEDIHTHAVSGPCAPASSAGRASGTHQSGQASYQGACVQAGRMQPLCRRPGAARLIRSKAPGPWVQQLHHAPPRRLPSLHTSPDHSPCVLHHCARAQHPQQGSRWVHPTRSTPVA